MNAENEVPPAARPRSPVSVLAGVLLVLGVLGLVLWKVESNSTALPYSSDATPASSVQVTAGRTYQLAVPGGVTEMQRRGVAVVASGASTVIDLRCTYTAGDGTGVRSLDVTAESADTKAENTVGEFVSPITGEIGVECAGWGAMFVPNADNRPFDTAGLVLLGATIALTLGVGLALSVAYRNWYVRRDADPALVPAANSDEDPTDDS